MSKLLLHKSTAAEVSRFVERPSQFLIITGPSGAGKVALAIQIGSQLLGLEIASEHPSVLRLNLQPNKSEISIDQVRTVIGQLKLTTTGKGNIRRLVLIEDGQYLGEEAQNALLKTLEEPPADSLIIMTLDSTSSILPTITSRGRIIQAHPVELKEAQGFFSDRSSETEIEKSWLLADGFPGLTAALLSHSDMHELKTAVADAKEFLGSTKYQRLIRANEFTKNRRQMELLIEGLQKVIKTAQRQSIIDNRSANQTKISSARKQLDKLHNALRANVSLKTIYLKLCLNLGL